MKNSFLLGVIVLFLISIPYKFFGQVPYFGTASSFAIFSACGAFDNVGAATYVTGDVGTNIGAFNAFPTGIVVGQIHVADSVSAKAANDVDIAYNYLSGITGGIVIETSLGDGQVLAPGTYSLGAAATLNGDLILDGNGDSNAIFIFQIDGTFSTGTFSNIILINSASLQNVYWQINGKFELGDNSIFRGIVVANGAFTLLENASLYGSGLTRAGAISLHNNTVTKEYPPLPIELFFYDAISDNHIVTITWKTTSETNNDYFTIEKSKDAKNFEIVSNVDGAGNSNSLLTYSIKDNAPYEGISYYRLKQTDFDGKFIYSKIVKVNILQTIAFNIYPNPFTTYAIIEIKCLSKINNYELRIYDILGLEVFTLNITEQATTFNTSNLPIGFYFYNIIVDNKTIQSGKLISER